MVHSSYFISLPAVSKSRMTLADTKENNEAPNAASAADEERDLANAAGIISTEAEIKNLNEKFCKEIDELANIKEKEIMEI